VSQMTDKKILIADDEANVRLLVSRIVGQRFLVLEARDGEEAIEKLPVPTSPTSF